MELGKKLQRFKKQQEKCQSTLSNLATTKLRITSIGKPAPQTIKFSKDTERLQQINTVRTSTVSSQIKRVIDLLFETRQSLTPDQINEACYVDLRANKAVFDSLINNVKIKYDGNRFSYKSTHEVKDKNELLVLIRKHPEGIELKDVKDSYKTVVDDIKALSEEGQIWVLNDSKEDIMYPNDPRIVIKVEEDLKVLFRDIELPADMVEIEKELEKNNMKPATDTAKRRAAAQVPIDLSKQKTKKKKKLEISKRTKLTNSHLPELFKNFGS